MLKTRNEIQVFANSTHTHTHFGIHVYNLLLGYDTLVITQVILYPDMIIKVSNLLHLTPHMRTSALVLSHFHTQLDSPSRKNYYSSNNASQNVA